MRQKSHLFFILFFFLYTGSDKQSSSDPAQEQTVDSQTLESKSESEEEEEEEEESAEEGRRDDNDEGNEQSCTSEKHTAERDEISRERHNCSPLNNVKENKEASLLTEEFISAKGTGDAPKVKVEKAPLLKLTDEKKDEKVRSDNCKQVHESQSHRRGGKASKTSRKEQDQRENVLEEGSTKYRYSSSLVSASAARSPTPQSPLPCWPEADKHSLSATVRSPSSSSRTGNSSHMINSKYKYSCKLSPSVVSSSPGAALSSFDRQMALVMTSMPLALLAKGSNAGSPSEAKPVYFPSISGMSSPMQEDQPLDLSKKSYNERRHSENDVTQEQSTLLTAPLQPKPTSLSTLQSSSVLANGFSSLQSLQQRFGGEFPIEATQSSGSSVIPLQPSVTSKPFPCGAPTHPLTADITNLRMHGNHRFKQNGNMRSAEWLEKHERTMISRSSSSPSAKQERKSRPQPASPINSPVEDSEASEVNTGACESGGSKHTIHRCSCHKTFGSLYGLSVHLQETGHAPGASRSASVMDYPKLVRGQDMWLNQESEQTRRILRCMQCGESFKSLPLLTVHMMQTQHYTKIVSSEHGRRSHKCSTYCDRELDKECIFKCKVCHETFTDMEGLANHMIVSGHHKKQSSSRHVTITPSQTSLSDVTGLSRNGGRRKRFLREDIASATAAAEIVAIPSNSTSSNISFSDSAPSVSDYSGKLNSSSCFSVSGMSSEALVNGFHLDGFKGTSLSSKPLSSSIQGDKTSKTVLCDSCGKRFDALIFDAHVRACLRQRAEVIDALKSKLAVEEALLSRSESKLLRSGFTLSSSSSAAVGGLSEEPLSVKSEVDISREPENFLGEGSSEMDNVHDNSQPVISRSEPGIFTPIVRDYTLPICQTPPRSPCERDSTTPKAKICDLIEVPLKKWYCSQRDESTRRDSTSLSNEIDHKELLSCASKENHDTEWKSKIEETVNKLDFEKHCEANPNVFSSSPHSGQKRKLGDVGSPGSTNSNDSIPIKSRQQADGEDMKSKEDATSQSFPSTDTPADFTSSALHKLDMFSRGLKLSPPRRATLSPEGSRQTTHHSTSGCKTARRREASGSNRTSTGRRESIASKSPMTASLSPISLTKSEGSPEPQRDVTFDILDPNMGTDDSISSSSAIEAMESFIHKSFSAKSELRTSNLATMFSPFRTCFPLPGSLPGHMSADPTDPALSCFAKFSKFFRMVPGAPSLPDITTSRSSDQKQNSSSFDLSSATDMVKTNSSLYKHDTGKLLNSKLANSNFGKPFIPRPLKGYAAKCLSSPKGTDSATSTKRYKYSSLNPEEVAKQMLQGGHYQNSRCLGPSSSVLASTPLAASCNSSARLSSKDLSISRSALPSSSDIEKIKSEVKRKRKLSSCAESFENMDTRKSIKAEDEDHDEVLRTDNRETMESKSDIAMHEYNKDQMMPEKASDEVILKRNDSPRLSDTSSTTYDQYPSSIADEAYFQPSERSKDIDCLPMKEKSLIKNQETIKSLRSGVESPTVEDESEKSLTHFLGRDEIDKESLKCKTISLDINEGVNNKDNESAVGVVRSLEETQRSGERGYTGEQFKQLTDNDEINCSSPSKKQPKDESMLKSNKSNIDILRINSPSHSKSDVHEMEVSTDDAPCNGVEKPMPIQSTRQACSETFKEKKLVDVDKDKTLSPLPYDQDDRVDESKVEARVAAIEMISPRLTLSSTLEKTSASRDQSEAGTGFRSAVKPFHSPSSSKHPDQSSGESENSNAFENINENVVTNKDNLQSGKLSSAINVERKSKHRPDTEDSTSSSANKNKSSALDSLSCFVYRQTLTSEHPLDSLQKLLSSNEPSLGQDGQNKCLSSSSFASKPSAVASFHAFPASRASSATSPHRISVSSPLNLSTNTSHCSSSADFTSRIGGKEKSMRVSGNEDTSDSDGNEEGHTNFAKAEDDDEATGSGGASDGEANVYKCAACNRQFASKGSYRYHLSRCHLSSVKKLGIKEAFNMSPYVYLPLDHTAKFSKYYQMAHELANKGK